MRSYSRSNWSCVKRICVTQCVVKNNRVNILFCLFFLSSPTTFLQSVQTNKRGGQKASKQALDYSDDDDDDDVCDVKVGVT